MPDHINSIADKDVPMFDDITITSADAINMGDTVGKEFASSHLLDSAVLTAFDNKWSRVPMKAVSELGEI